MRKSRSGFTIVELLIVIVVIAILATIVIVAYNGVQTRAQNTARLTQLKDWQKIFELYKASEGDYPAMPNGTYCLGTGFPAGWDGVPRCRDYQYDGDTDYKESDASALMTSLKTASANLPGGPYVPVNGTVGPYVEYSDDNLQLFGIFKGDPDDCPDGTDYGWDDGDGLLICMLTLERN